MPRKIERADPVPAAAPAGASSITRSLLDWYDRHRRILPWRAKPGETPDPYRIWLSEVMLQQTTVAAVKPYFARFLALWPTVADLAEAPSEAVMREWAGLGYYARARNLHACANAVVVHFGGRFPPTETALRALPGIGDYTAAAVAAIAFGEAATVVDGNVERVVARLFALETPLPEARPAIRRLAATLVSADRPGDFAQATMDFGATLCTPRSPACAICPVRRECQARVRGVQQDLPRRSPRAMRPQRFGAAVVLRRPDGAILVRTRPSSGLLGGMTEVFGTDWTEAPPALSGLEALPDHDIAWRGTVDHVFTHFALRLDVYAGRTSRLDAPVGWRWVAKADLGSEALPNLMVKVLALAAGSPVPAADPDRLQLPGLVAVREQDGGAGRQRAKADRTKKVRG
ncbi:MAG TPA: A/G-specific adenine glycosylase [Lichenihabitans sp.]|jgi:A/G-specific adenine glycosylase|nr:A/G-specific adenine glycosylase [Lichenihabitans sp.]